MEASNHPNNVIIHNVFLKYNFVYFINIILNTKEKYFRFYYLASNFTHINWVVITTTASVFVIVSWVFPSLKKKKKKDLLEHITPIHATDKVDHIDIKR